MNLANIKILYVSFCIMLSLIILLPIFFAFFPFPEGKGFSELWLLGSNQMITSGTLDVLLNNQYTVNIGVRNQKLGLQYYKLYAKLRNQSEVSQEMSDGVPSSSDSIFEYRFFLNSNETWEENFIFIFKDVSFEENISRISNLSINDNDVNMDKILIQNDDTGDFLCQMIFELWIYNYTASFFQFHNHYVGFWLNLVKQI